MNTGFMVIVDISGYTSFIKAHSKSEKSNFIKKIIDKINDGHGEQLIMYDDKLFQQHLPKNRLYPGSMILEGALQSAAALIYLRYDQAYLPIIFSANIRFLKPVMQNKSISLTHKVSLSKELRGLCDVKAETYFDLDLISRFSLGYSLRPTVSHDHPHSL